MNTKAIQLSANFLVIMIISVVLFGMGIFIVNKIFTSADNMVFEMDATESKRLASMLTDGDKVAILWTKKTAEPKDPAYFPVAIENTLGENKAFAVLIRFNAYYDENDEEKTPRADPNTWIKLVNKNEINNKNEGADSGYLLDFSDAELGEIENNGRKEFTIAIVPEAGKDEPGTYVFDMIVGWDNFPEVPPPPFTTNGIVNCKDVTSFPETLTINSCTHQIEINKLYDSKINKLYVEI